MTDEREGLPSASSMDRVVRCPGSYLREKAYARTEGSASRRGTKIHEALEGKRPWDSLGKSDMICGMRIAAEEAALVCKYNMEGAIPFKEQRIFFIDDTFEKVFSAKADVMHMLGGRCLLINYKTGWYDTTPIKDNWQIAAEAVCAAQAFRVNKIAAALIHPNASTLKQTIVIGKNRLKEMAVELEHKSKLAMREDAPINAGEIQCKWCKARENCFAYTEWSAAQCTGKPE